MSKKNIITIKGEEMLISKVRKFSKGYYKIGDINIENSGDCYKIDNKFQHSPLEPRYVVLSPQSMKKFYEFVSAEESVEDKHATKRNFNANKAKNNKKDKIYPP